MRVLISLPVSGGGVGKGMARGGPKALPLGAQEGQTERRAQRDQRPPRPLREGNRGEKEPRRL